VLQESVVFAEQTQAIAELNDWRGRRRYERARKNLICRDVTRYYVHFCADRAKTFMPVKCFVRFPVGCAQDFNLFHFLVIFFGAGKKLEQPRFERIIRKRRFRIKLFSPQTQVVWHEADFCAVEG
jgi:hypothetical protein